jgi:hypothetical protein
MHYGILFRRNSVFKCLRSIKPHRTGILSAVLHGYDAWSLTIREEHRLSASGEDLDLSGRK